MLQEFRTSAPLYEDCARDIVTKMWTFWTKTMSQRNMSNKSKN